MLCLYVPEDVTNETISIEMIFSPKHYNSINLIRRGTMWENSIILKEKPSELKYWYKIKMNKSIANFFSRLSIMNEVVDEHERIISWEYAQRDIFPKNKKHLDNKGYIEGIVAHVKDILQDPKYETEAAFHELDNIQSRNTINVTHWTGAYEKLFDGQFNDKLCLLLLYCMQKEYVTSAFPMNTASKIWAEVKHLGQESKDICVQFAGEMFEIYEALRVQQCFPLHFINDMQSVLNISSLHRVLSSRSHYPIHDCKESLACLRKSLQFVVNQDCMSNTVYKMAYLIFDYIPEREILEGYVILNELNVPDKKKDLKKNIQKHVIEKIKKILASKVSYSDFKAVNDILSKAEGDFKRELFQQCETEIIVCIRKTGGFGYAAPWKNLEHFCIEQFLFQTRDQQLMFLEAVINMPSYDKPRDLIQYILMHFQTKESDCAKKTLEEAYDIVLETVYHRTSSEAKLKLCFEEYDALFEKSVFQIIRDYIERKLQQHISNIHIKSLLKIHADVDNLHSETNEFYCHQLQEKLKTWTFQEKFDFLKSYWKKLNSRYMYW